MMMFKTLSARCKGWSAVLVLLSIASCGGGGGGGSGSSSATTYSATLDAVKVTKLSDGSEIPTQLSNAQGATITRQ